MRLENVKGVGESTLKKLESLDIKNIGQLINFLPHNYIDFNSPDSLASVSDGQFSLLRLRIIKVSGLVKTKGGLQFFSADAVDFLDTNLSKNKIKLTWFNMPYMLANVRTDECYLVFGKVKVTGNKKELNNPQIENLNNAKKLVGIMPLYRTRGYIKQGSFRSLIEEGIKGYKPTRIIPDDTAKKNGLLDLYEAYNTAHNPQSIEDGLKAQERIALEDTVKEILYFKLINRQAKNNRIIKYNKDFSVINDLIKSLPYELTISQKKALKEIAETLSSNIRMNRLLIGDVGSGKTIVALISMFYAVKCGYQSAIIAPTEILAEQHYRTAKRLLSAFDVNIVFHSGSIQGAERKNIERSISDGTADIVIGTHSVFQKGIEFNNLSLAVIDEQHKFGVAQKYDFQQKGVQVDTLTLTATPIPRSVLMLLYDELQLSQIEKNKRSKVSTYIVSENKKQGMFSYIRDEAKKGNQAFIVCPKIFDSEGVETYSATTLFEELSEGIFSDIKVALIHGKMRAKDKVEVMENFANGSIDVLISTTVIEVGIDIQNATTIAVLNSEMFGLATLHQLRGRVGRGEKHANCFLHTLNPQNERLKALVETDDGYKLAELDFTIRGGGDYLGTRQSGEYNSGKYAMAVTPDLIKTAQRMVVDEILPNGIELTEEDYNYYLERFKDVTLS